MVFVSAHHFKVLLLGIHLVSAAFESDVPLQQPQPTNQPTNQPTKQTNQQRQKTKQTPTPGKSLSFVDCVWMAGYVGAIGPNFDERQAEQGWPGWIRRKTVVLRGGKTTTKTPLEQWKKGPGCSKTLRRIPVKQPVYWKVRPVFFVVAQIILGWWFRWVVSNIFYFQLYLGKWSDLTDMFHMVWFNHHLEKPSRLSPMKLLGDDIHTYLVGETILTFSIVGDDYICSRKK